MCSVQDPFDYFSDLPSELILYLFTFLNDADLCRARLVCKSWNSIAFSPPMFRHLCKQGRTFSTSIHTKCLDDITNDRSLFFFKLVENKDQKWARSRQQDWCKLYKEIHQLNANYTYYLRPDLLKEGLLASSSDHPQQGINQTLANGGLFWSSVGSSSPNSDEFLVYRLMQCACIVTAVEITPYKALFQRGFPIYASHQIQISVGNHPDRMHWIGPRMDLINSNIPQTYMIDPALVVGGYVRIDLYGKYQTQPQDSLYYTVLDMVRCFGIPLGALGCATLARSILRGDLQGTQCLTDPPSNESSTRLEEDPASIFLHRLQGQILETNIRWAIERNLRTQLAESISMQQWTEAVDIAISGIEHGLRNHATLDMFVAASPPLEEDPTGGVAGLYLIRLMQFHRLEVNESLHFARISLAGPARSNLRSFIVNHQLEASEALGDLLREYSKILPSRRQSLEDGMPEPSPQHLEPEFISCLETAILVYTRANAWDKMLSCLVDTGRYWLIVSFALTIQHEADWPSLVQHVLRANGRNPAVHFVNQIAEAFLDDADLHQALATVLPIEVLDHETPLDALRRTEEEVNAVEERDVSSRNSGAYTEEEEEEEEERRRGGNINAF